MANFKLDSDFESVLKTAIATPQRAPNSLSPPKILPPLNYPAYHFDVILRDWGTADKMPDLSGMTIKSSVTFLIRANPAPGAGNYAPYKELLTRASGLEAIKLRSICGILFPDGANPPAIGLPEALKRAGGQEERPGPGYVNPTGPQTGLKDGIWHHMPTSREFPITDIQWGRNAEDAPLLALGHNLARVVNSDNRINDWYDEYPPPMRPKYPQMMPTYVRAMRSYLKKFAIEIIEAGGWVLLWRGYLYTNGIVNFKQIFKQSTLLKQWAQNNQLTDTSNNVIAVIDARNNQQLKTTTWEEILQATSIGATGTESGPLRSYLRSLSALILSYDKTHTTVKPGINENLRLEIFHALCETQILQESLTYNQMLTATAQFWRTRLKTVRQVHTHPPSLITLQDGTVDLNFHFESRPSTEGKPHNGYVKFIPEIGKTNWLDKVKELLGTAAKNIGRFFGKKVPPQILKGSDLRKMLVECSCDCLDFRYRMSWANVKHGVTSQQGRTDNGQEPIIRNPRHHPGFCKHCLATVRYLTDDAELTIEPRLTPQQQEALRIDREQFMKEAMEQYEKMQAPAAEPEEEEVPEEEPEPEQYGNLPPPPAPEQPARPENPPTPPPPYTATQ